MTLMTKLRGLPAVPPAVESHPSWLEHGKRLAALTAAVAATRAGVDALEQEHTRISATVSADSVLELLAEDPAAGERLAAGKRRLTEIDERLRDARARVAVQAEAIAVVEARTAGIRDGIVLEMRQRVERAYVALNTELAHHFAALAPVNARLLELRREHGGRPTGADLDSRCGGTN